MPTPGHTHTLRKHKAAPFTAWRIFVLACLLCIGCSKTQIAYNFSDWFLLRTIDKYFDTTAAQNAYLEERLDALFVWHRQREMPEIAAALEELRERIRDGLTGEDIDWVQEDHRNYFKRFFIRFAPDFAHFMTTVQPEQLNHLKDRLEKGNDFLIKQLAMSDEEMQMDAADWLIKLLGKWVGPLDAAQQEKVRSWITLERSWLKDRLNNRRKFQNAFAALIEAKKPAAEIEARLIEWLEKPEIRWSPEFMDRVNERNRQWREILIRIDGILTSAQRNHLLGRLDQYIEDFKDLAEEPPAPLPGADLTVAPKAPVAS